MGERHSVRGWTAFLLLVLTGRELGARSRSLNQRCTGSARLDSAGEIRVAIDRDLACGSTEPLTLERPPNLDDGLGLTQRPTGEALKAAKALADGVDMDAEIASGRVDAEVVR
jgi:hypothetical protein